MGNLDSKPEERLGRCFELAAKFVLDHPEWSLVHAVITDKVYKTGNSIVHAWCEKEHDVFDIISKENDRLVFDPVTLEELPARIYYALNGVIDYHYNKHELKAKIPETPKVIYSADEMKQLLSETKTFGPWNESIINHKDIINAVEVLTFIDSKND